MERPQRKRLRLESYDYSQPGSYFITICTRERNPEVPCSNEPAVGAIINRPSALFFSNCFANSLSRLAVVKIIKLIIKRLIFFVVASVILGILDSLNQLVLGLNNRTGKLIKVNIKATDFITVCLKVIHIENFRSFKVCIIEKYR